MEVIDRIEQAKQQYENLLLNLGSGALDDCSFDENPPQHNKSSGIVSYADIGVGNDLDRCYTDTFRQSGAPETSFHELQHSLEDQAFIQREDTVVCQQTEIERLRRDLATLTLQAETDASETKRKLTKMQGSCDRWQEEAAHLREENKLLKQQHEDAQRDLNLERERLSEALNKIKRLSMRRGEFESTQGTGSKFR